MLTNRARFYIFVLAVAIGGLVAAAVFPFDSHAAPSLSMSLAPNEDQLAVGSHLTRSASVPAELVGWRCTVTTVNGESVHTGASIVFTSGSSVTLPDVEETSGKVTQGGVLVLGATVVADVTVGQDPQYEPGLGGFSMQSADFACVPPPPPSTQPPTTTTRPLPPPVVVPPTRFTG